MPQLWVEVIEARNVRKADILTDSDPYAVVSFNGQELKTDIIDNTSAPTWNQGFLFAVPGDVHPLKDDSQELRVTLWDDDYLGRDYLGEVTVSLKTLSDEHVHDRWIKLLDGRAHGKGTITGDVRIELAYLYNPSGAFPQEIQDKLLPSYSKLLVELAKHNMVRCFSTFPTNRDSERSCGRLRTY